MSENTIQKLNTLGQSIWLDNINRAMLEGGELKKLINLGLRGLTSNPTIFDKAVSASDIYDKQIAELGKEEKTTFDIYDDLTIKDIQAASDLFKTVYDESNRLDGYVSLEINPKLAHKIPETIAEGKRLFRKVARPNVMFKVPATPDGLKAIEELTAEGISVNITLIFSLQQYIDSANAYMRGMKSYISHGGWAHKVRSVASVFISRIDTAIDKVLDEKKLRELIGKAAVANTKLIYKKYREILDSEEFKELASKGTNVQRVLWGSTSTKNPDYSDVKYVEELIGKDSINTLPRNTFDAMLDHGKVSEALTADSGDAEKIIEDLKKAGIDINVVCAKLLEDGVKSFEKSFDSLLSTIEKKKKELCVVK